MKKILTIALLGVFTTVGTVSLRADDTAATAARMKIHDQVEEMTKTDEGCTMMCEEMMKNPKSKKMMTEMIMKDPESMKMMHDGMKMK